MRFNELLSGVRADVAVKVYGDDTARLAEIGAAIEDLVSGVVGAQSVTSSRRRVRPSCRSHPTAPPWPATASTSVTSRRWSRRP